MGWRCGDRFKMVMGPLEGCWVKVVEVAPTHIDVDVEVPYYAHMQVRPMRLRMEVESD